MPTYCIVSDDDNRCQGVVVAPGDNDYSSNGSFSDPIDMFQTEFILTRIEDAYLLMDDNSTKLWIATFSTNQSFDYDAEKKTVKCSKIILSEPYPLHDVTTYRDPPLCSLRVSLDNLSLHRALDVLKWIRLDDLDVDSLYTEKAIDTASGQGDIDILDWWLQSNLPLKYTSRAINIAALGNKLDVLEWWIKSKLPLKYSDEIPMLVAKLGNVEVLDWWVDHKWSVRVSLDVFVNASIINKNVKILEWWKNFVIGYPDKIKLECPTGVIDAASRFGYLDVLDWWLDVHNKYKIKLVYTEYAIDYASADGMIEVLEWWKQSNLPLLYTAAAVDKSLSGRHCMILDWWDNSGLEMRYTHVSMDYASMIGHIPVLEWWLGSRHEPWYSYRAFINASQFNQLDVLLWWADSGLKITRPRNSELKTYSPRIQEWWRTHFDSSMYSSDDEETPDLLTTSIEKADIEPTPTEIEVVTPLVKKPSRELVVDTRTYLGVKLNCSAITYATMFVALTIWYAGIYYLWKHRRIHRLFSWNSIRTVLSFFNPKNVIVRLTS